MMVSNPWIESLATALAAIRAHKLRAALTMLGVVIGVVSVISVAAVIHGLNQHIANQVQSIGARSIFITRVPAFHFEQWPEEIRAPRHEDNEETTKTLIKSVPSSIVTPFRT